jgi:hypothetical protein
MAWKAHCFPGPAKMAGNCVDFGDFLGLIFRENFTEIHFRHFWVRLFSREIFRIC